MNLRAADFYMTRFAHSLPGAMKMLGDLESDLLADRLKQVSLDRPIFITGLARSGTTILLNVFSQLPQVATHRYRDFPFLFVPYAWNRLQNGIAREEEAIERPHKDRIKITKDSPEAFEEPLWSHFFPAVHEKNCSHVLSAATAHPAFEAFYRAHLRKVLLLRGGDRYVSKGNYNIARIEYLAKLFPDARFVIPVRHPISQVESLVRQHRLFTEYSERDPRVPAYMQAAGHYEFGPQRIPVNLDLGESRRILQAWSEGQDSLGYAVMWRSVYSHASRLATQHEFYRSRIKIVRYEDLCSDPIAFFRGVFAFCELSKGVDESLGVLPEISAGRTGANRLPDSPSDQIWRETAELARLFGYEKNEIA